MKKFAAFVAVLVMLCCVCVAETAPARIIDLFPDEAFAKVIRDQCVKFSVEQPVTMEELSRIERLSLYTAEIRDFAGIGYLKNLKSFSTGSGYQGQIPEELRQCRALEYLSMQFDRGISVVPEWIGEFERLKMLDLPGASFSALPDSVCDLKNLTQLSVGYNENLTALPENIGSLSNLRELYIYETSISTLPESIGALSQLRELDISNTPISSLPESIWSLELTSLDMTGTSIR